MRRYVVPLFAANSVALATIGISYLLYSRLLSAQQFGVYAAALAVGNLATLVLDGGIKVSIIKHPVTPTNGEERALLHLMLGFSLVLLAALVSFRSGVAHFYPALRNQTDFVASFAGVYLLTYPWIGLPTAQLERRLAYPQLAWIESTGLILERGVPALFLSFTGLGLYSFVWSLLIGRLVRVIALALHHPVALRRTEWTTYGAVVKIIREGVWYQLGLGSSLLRDNLHIMLIGPLYGAAWVGYYAWGLQMCMISSQVFVQISARISLPIAAQRAEFANRWPMVLRQVGLLTAVTAPILAGALLVAPSAIHRIFADKWLPALPLLPYLFLRMLPGAATAPIGALVLVERGSRTYALTVWLWTLAEVAMGAVAVHLLGRVGLAVSYAAAAWLGAFLLVHALSRGTMRLFRDTISAIFARPSLWASLLLAVPCALAETLGRDWLSQINFAWALVAMSALVLAFYASDTDLRATLLRRNS